MYCTNCGNECNDGDNVCTQCGSSLLKEGRSEMNVKYAGFWIRFLAYLIDGIVVGIGCSVVGGVLGLIMGFNFFAGDAFYEGGAYILTIRVVCIVLAWLYFALLESSEKMATLGKMAVGIQVRDVDGQKLTFARATGRYFAKILSGLVFCIGYIIAAFTAKKQALHDFIASTLVVYKN